MTAKFPGLLDRLMGQQAQPGRASVEQLKDNVARDLEALLNARVGLPPDAFDAYPLARASILNYGLTDFAAFCLSSSEDRAAICACLKEAIERHEPRLKNVSAVLAPGQGGVNRLSFVINATLHAGPGAAVVPVNFNAVLQPSSLNYAISKAAPSTPQRTSTWIST
ncbi:type VI secretion system baseplate subunit TssE [Massilia phosphatilytica]|nr:type VI secretion system baseplate subunit TssE [Massilia phosphatilytica]